MSQKKSEICWDDQEQDIRTEGGECGQGIYKMFEKLVATKEKLHYGQQSQPGFEQVLTEVYNKHISFYQQKHSPSCPCISCIFSTLNFSWM